MSETVEKTLTIVNKLGLHARAAAQFVQLAGKFASEVFINKGDQEVNGKSIMGILILAASKGTEVRIRAEGEDAVDAVAALAALVEDGFGEE